MTPHQILAREKFLDYTINDTGDATTFIVDRNRGVIRLVSGASGETRTLGLPPRSGLEVTLNMVTDGGGDITVTVTGNYTESGSSTLVFNDTGDLATFKSVEEGSGTFVWRLIAFDGVTGPTETQGSLSLAGTLTVAGASTLAAATASGLITGSAGIVAKSATAAAITTTRTLTSSDSGGCFSVAKTSAYAITLPTPAQGLRFKFMVLDTGANAVTISNGSAHLFGTVSVNNVSTAMTGTTLSLASAGSVGDWVEFEGIDATHYLVTGACIAAADITIA